MSELRTTSDDEIDIFELFETLWEGKWLIIIFLSLTTVFGLSYSIIQKPIYQVTVSYSFNFYSLGTQQLCGNNVGCMDSRESEKLLFALSDGWRRSGKNLSLSLLTENPSSAVEYNNEIEEINRLITSNIYDEAKEFVDFARDDINRQFLYSEIFADFFLKANTTIKMIDDGKYFIEFGTFSISKKSPNFSIILIMGALLGGALGVLFVVGRSVIRNRKKHSAKD